MHSTYYVMHIVKITFYSNLHKIMDNSVIQRSSKKLYDYYFYIRCNFIVFNSLY